MTGAAGSISSRARSIRSSSGSLELRLEAAARAAEGGAAADPGIAGAAAGGAIVGLVR
jgi:hypothetical protein